MSKIADYAMNNKLFRRVVSTDKKIIPYISPAHASLKVENTNELLKAYPDIIGVKTGYTRAAKGCLVAVATRRQGAVGSGFPFRYHGYTLSGSQKAARLWL